MIKRLELFYRICTHNGSPKPTSLQRPRGGRVQLSLWILLEFYSTSEQHAGVLIPSVSVLDVSIFSVTHRLCATEDDGSALVHTRGLSPRSPSLYPDRCIMLVLPCHPSEHHITILARSAALFKL